MQMFLQSQTDNDLKEMKGMMEKREKMKKVWKSLEKWKPFSSLSKDLRSQIFLCDDPKWLETKGINLKSFLENIWPELILQIKSQLCFPLLYRVPALEKVDKGSIEALCKRAKPILFLETSSIIHNDAPIDKMCIIIGRNIYFYDKQECTNLILGEELLQQVINSAQSSNFPRLCPVKTIFASSKVEVFSIAAFDMKKVRIQFRGRFSEEEKKEWANSSVQKVISKFLQKRAVYSPKNPAETTGTAAFDGHVIDRDGIETGELSPTRKDDPCGDYTIISISFITGSLRRKINIKCPYCILPFSK